MHAKHLVFVAGFPFSPPTFSLLPYLPRGFGNEFCEEVSAMLSVVNMRLRPHPPPCQSCSLAPTSCLPPSTWSRYVKGSAEPVWHNLRLVFLSGERYFGLLAWICVCVCQCVCVCVRAWCGVCVWVCVCGGGWGGGGRESGSINLISSARVWGCEAGEALLQTSFAFSVCVCVCGVGGGGVRGRGGGGGRSYGPGCR